MELGLTIPLQKHLRCKTPPPLPGWNRRFCWDLHIIPLRGQPSLLAVHCESRYAFTLFGLHPSGWLHLRETFLDGLQRSFAAAGVPSVATRRYLRCADPVQFTKTHGRREVAFLNRAWTDVLALDYALDTAMQGQPLLDGAINRLPCRCAGFAGTGDAAGRLLQSLAALE